MQQSDDDVPNISFQQLRGPVTERFDCGRDDQTRYLLDYAWTHQLSNVSLTFVMRVDEELVGYITVCNDRIPLLEEELPPDISFPRQLPALKLAQLGVQKNQAGKGYGTYLIAFGLMHAVNQETCRFATLDSQPDLVSWYEKRGFVRNEREQKEREQQHAHLIKKNRAEPGTHPAVSMRLDLHMLDPDMQMLIDVLSTIQITATAIPTNAPSVLSAE